MRTLSCPRRVVRLEDYLGPQEPPYRSRGEAQIGRLLDRYGIPFLYEHPLPIDDGHQIRTWHPDFSLPYPRDPSRQPLLIEYAGMPDRPRYRADLRYKQRVYRANGQHAMFIYPRDLAGPRWPQRLGSRIRNYRHHGYSSR